MVNYHLVLLAGPPAVLGAFLGTSLNKLASESIIMGTMMLLQIYLLIYSFNTYRAKKRDEKAKAADYKNANDISISIDF